MSSVSSTPSMSRKARGASGAGKRAPRVAPRALALLACLSAAWLVPAPRARAAACTQAVESHSDPVTLMRWPKVSYCDNAQGATLYLAPAAGAPVGYMDSTRSWFVCWDYGATVSGFNVWYYTQGDRTVPGREDRLAWGYMSAAQVFAGSHPYPGIPRCNPALPSPPTFSLPFTCGETWELRTRDDHDPDDRKVDFYRVGFGTHGNVVLAPAPGVVHEVFPSVGGIEIDHGGGFFSLYLHMDAIAVGLGAPVARGQKLGEVSNIGDTFPPTSHLHYELMYDFNHDNDGDGDGASDRYDYPSSANPEVNRTDQIWPIFEGATWVLDPQSWPRLTSRNTCPAGGAPQAMVQYDVGGLGQLQIWARRTGDDDLIQRWYDPATGTWNLGAFAASLAGRPAAAVYDGRLQIAARQSTNKLTLWTFTPGAGWSQQDLIGFAAGDPDLAFYPHHSNLHAVARGTDGKLWHWWTSASGAWGNPELMDGALLVSGAPAIAAFKNDFHVMARGASDQKLYHWRYDRSAGTWSKQALAGFISAGPDLLVGHDDQLHAVARGTDGKLYEWTSSAGTTWSAPSVVDSVTAVVGTPGLAVYNGAFHVVARGADSRLHHWWRASGAWSHEVPSTVTASGDPNVAVYRDQFQVALRGTSGRLYSVWYAPSSGWHTELRGDLIEP